MASSHPAEMMGVIRITRISVETLCHATEDAEKVRTLMQEFAIPLEQKTLRGYFGNPIVMVSGEIRKRKDIESFMNNLRQKVSAEDVDFSLCTDEEGPLYLRFDKQELARGKLSLKGDGEVKLTIFIQAYPHRKEEAFENARKVFCGL